MGTRLTNLVGLIFGCGLLFLAYDRWEEAGRVRAEYDAQAQLVAGLISESQELGMAPVEPLQPSQDSLEEFLSHIIDDTELLGSSVRLDVDPQVGIQWVPVKYNVQKASLALETATEKSAAMGYFTLLWQLLDQQPVEVTSAKIEVQEEDAVIFKIQVDLYGLVAGGAG